jgi:beta-glucosidase
MRKLSKFWIVIVLFSCSSTKEITNSENEEIKNWINSLSIEEKVGQTCQITLDVVLKRDASGNPVSPTEIDTNLLKIALEQYHVGSILNVSSHTLTLNEWQGIFNDVHRPYQSGATKIPVIYGIDAIHGMNYTVGATLFPQEIGLAATWNTELAKQMGEITAYETRASGIRWNFSPVLDLGRQPLWSRHFETLGEDPYLASEMGTALVKGYQGDSIDPFHVAACLKHFVGYSASLSGRDRTPAWIPEKYMQELYLPSFKKAIENGALTVMVNSGSVNGIPGHLNYNLLTETLKEEWGFKGFAVSDWEDFIMLHTVHHSASSLQEAYVRAFNAGVDMSMVPLAPQYQEYCELMVDAVKKGLISEERLNDAVERILYVKNEIGLFDDLNFNQEDYSNFASESFKNVAKNAALESITLLKNENDILPIKSNQKILVCGPTSNDLVFLNGAWTHTWQGMDTSYNTKNCLNIRQAVENKFGKENVLFSQGVELFMNNNFEDSRFTDTVDFSEKLKLADAVFMCLGELPSTEKPGDIKSLNLNDAQLELAKMAINANKKLILILTEGRPRIIHDIVPGADAIIQCYLPGDYGAEALVELISGDENFTGKLPYSYPKFDGVIEFYDHPFSVDRPKAGSESAYDPEWDFGFGLSYSNFKYSDIKINKPILVNDDSITVSVKVTNTSNVDGKEVVQCYLSDVYASMVPQGKKLVDFSKIILPSGKNETIQFSISKNDLMFCNEEGNFVAEDGEFTITIGSETTNFTYKNEH